MQAKIKEYLNAHKNSSLAQDVNYDEFEKVLIEVSNTKEGKDMLECFLFDTSDDSSKALLFQALIDYAIFVTKGGRK